ncbi:Uncharacterized protein YnzC, UPF0291/DUF896 family [Caloramator fervidus]|uniref:UPF0291 protein SAMN05660865_01299 n=1 Tax=Caloramator fervidus TaxID=29344 RepID=A0A1H5VT46_9CLOT|nr:DUF896 domain-containing protein [Caloramator fervidus]SEF90404.1 Uncharacterized protein YnzC, UPF0291/DUF896 family [Caloramator fervidus]
MITKEQIARINELYKKQVEGTLTEEEKKEQAYLRRLYVDAIKQSLKAQLDSIKIVTPEEYEKLKKEKGGCCGHSHCNHKH